MTDYIDTIKRLRDCWCAMRHRCFNIKSVKYKNYGGRGVTVCDEWRYSFHAFRVWAIDNGYDNNLTIDREDNDGDYEPGNCRWVTNTIQSQNRREDRICKSGYRGVTTKPNGSFKATVRFCGKRYYVRTCKTASLAALYRNLYIIVNNLPNRLNTYASSEPCLKAVSG